MANIFPRGSNLLPLKIVLCVLVLVPAVSLAMWYYFTPKYTRVGYQPAQPVPFPHDVHVAQLGMDCRYCHSFVEVAAHSNVPTTQVCMNCHSQVQKDNPKLAPLRESWATGKPIEWVQVHKTPDYVYFNHSAHVNRGVSLRELPRPGGQDAGRLSRRVALDGVVPGLPSQSGERAASARSRSRIWTGSPTPKRRIANASAEAPSSRSGKEPQGQVAHQSAG